MRGAKRARSVATMTSEVTDLLQHLIRNACVNDGDESSGQEVRSADLLQTYLEGVGLNIERYEPAPGRTSLVTRIEGIGEREFAETLNWFGDDEQRDNPAREKSD